MSLKKQKTHYTEARLVQILEKRGIGRPSTFSSLISKIQERNYVKKQDVEGKVIKCTDYKLEEDELQEIDTKRVFGNEKGKLVIQPIGILVMEYLLEGFNELFVYEYTSNMEDKLDEISRGEYEWKKLCDECDSTIKTMVKKTNNKSPNIKIDEHHTYMVSKYGPYIFYKTERIEKPKFISFNNVKGENPDILNWRNLSNDAISDIVEEYIR